MDIMSRLWVDDLRLPPDDGWRWADTSIAAISWLATYQVEEMSLDHDLGGSDTTRPVVLWLCEHENRWPRIVRVHTANPVGREYLLGMIYRYSPYQSRTY